ncbi:MAG: hypothetical protein ACK5BV_03635, partial [Bacteroidota bacterium]
LLNQAITWLNLEQQIKILLLLYKIILSADMGNVRPLRKVQVINAGTVFLIPVIHTAGNIDNLYS